MSQSLADIQLALQNYLLGKQRDLDSLTLETPQFSREERLFIYHNAYRLRLIDALRNDYPALEMYLGEDDFVQLCGEFIAAHPSQHPSLRWLGEKFPDFLRGHEHYGTQVSVIELAEFEWAQTMVFDAADESAMDMDSLRNLQPEQWMSLELQFQDSVRLLFFETNAPAIWSSLVKENEVLLAEERKQAWLVSREDLQVVYRPVEEPEASAINDFLLGKNFADVCGGLCEWFEEEHVPLQAAQYLQRWIHSKLILSIKLSD